MTNRNYFISSVFILSSIIIAMIVLIYKTSEIEYIDKPRFVIEIIEKEQRVDHVVYSIKTETINHHTISEETHSRDFTEKALEIGDEIIKYHVKSQTFIKWLYIIVGFSLFVLLLLFIHSYFTDNA